MFFYEDLNQCPLNKYGKIDRQRGKKSTKKQEKEKNWQVSLLLHLINIKEKNENYRYHHHYNDYYNDVECR